MPEWPLLVRLLQSGEVLPPAAHPGADLFHGHAWIENFRRYGVAPGERVRLYVAQCEPGEGAPAVVLPAVYSRLYVAHPRARVLHFLQMDALELPAQPAAHGQTALALERVIAFLRGSGTAYDVLRFSPLWPGTEMSAELTALLRRTGHALQSYHLPPEYHEATAGLTSREYFTARPRMLREALEHIEQSLAGDGGATFRLIRRVDEVDSGLRDFRKVVDASDRDPEPEPPEFLPNAMRVAAGSDALRLGIVYLSSEPAAVQLWIVSAGVARCLRVWSAARVQALALEDLLTKRMAAHLIDSDHVAELSFGARDDLFVTKWAPAARVPFGLAAFNLRTWRGLKGSIRHLGAGMARSLLERIRSA